jgi:predicted heme/steroid binding protein
MSCEGGEGTRLTRQDDPISVAELRQYDGTDPSKPIYVAIKGRVFDVSHKKEMYGKGTGYNVFAGKDASKGLGGWSTAPCQGCCERLTRRHVVLGPQGRGRGLLWPE